MATRTQPTPTTRKRVVSATRQPATAAKPARKPVTPPAGKRVVGALAERKPAPIAEQAQPMPAKGKPKLVRDSFTIPKAEYALIAALKQRSATLARPVKKGELLRAGIASLNGMSDEAFLAAVNAVPSLKTGRPKGDDAAPGKAVKTRKPNGAAARG